MSPSHEVTINMQRLLSFFCGVSDTVWVTNFVRSFEKLVAKGEDFDPHDFSTYLLDWA